MRDLQWRLEALLLRAVLAALRLLPLDFARTVAGVLTSAALRLVPARRRLVHENLGLVYRDPEGRRVALGRVITALGHTVAEYGHLPRITASNLDAYVRWENEHHYREAKGAGRGVILFSGHFACWEWLALHVLRNGNGGVIVRPIRNPYVDGYINAVRAAKGLRMFSVRESFRDMALHLRQGGDLGFWIDQNCLRAEGVFVEFLGRPACTYKGLALLALRTKSPLVPIFALRGGENGRLVIHYEPPIWPERGEDLDQAVLALTQQVTGVIEKRVRAHPDQWFWIHNRWKTQPLEHVSL